MIQLMYIWFDRESLLINSTENIAAIDQTAQQLQKIIRYELKSGIPLERIVIGRYLEINKILNVVVPVL